MFSTDSRVLAAFAVTTSLAASLSFAIVPGAAHAQATDGATEEVRHDDEHAGGSRGGYAWGQEGDEQSGASGPAAHRFGRVFLSVGAGGTLRIIRYLELNQTFFAPPYLQLRGGYFFEGDGTVQHGVMLGVAPALDGDGLGRFGHDPFGQWTISPNYMARVWLDGDLGQWLQLTGRIGIPLALGEFFSWGFDVGVGAIVEFLTGLGIYVEADFSMFFGQDIHPLVSVEGGIVVEYEVLP